MNLIIRKYQPEDFEILYALFHRIMLPGDTHAWPPSLTKEDVHQLWIEESQHIFVAECDEFIVGSYRIKPNQMGYGSHVANGGYLVDPDFQGKGIGRQLVTHSLSKAKHFGFDAMQFNFVAETNTAAIALYKTFGFEIVGTVPEAFSHQVLGKRVSAHIMYLKL